MCLVQQLAGRQRGGRSHGKGAEPPRGSAAAQLCNVIQDLLTRCLEGQMGTAPPPHMGCRTSVANLPQAGLYSGLLGWPEVGCLVP